MPKLNKIYTRTGDDGSTGLGSGKRVLKNALRVEVYGTVDEANAFIGCALSCGLSAYFEKSLLRIQNDLLVLGSDLCIDESDKTRLRVPGIEQRHVDWLEKLMDDLSKDLEPLENFILPGGVLGASYLHVARTVVRRAERLLVGLAQKEKVGSHTTHYLNRLSDTLFVMARSLNKDKGVTDKYWDSYA